MPRDVENTHYTRAGKRVRMVASGDSVPTISEFQGIVIEMFHGDQSPPHFHATYGGESVLVAINPVRIDRGRLPRRTQRMVIEWAILHQSELLANWDRVDRLVPLLPIDPLPR
jgi:hypothetical protein